MFKGSEISGADPRLSAGWRADPPGAPTYNFCQMFQKAVWNWENFLVAHHVSIVNLVKVYGSFFPMLWKLFYNDGWVFLSSCLLASVVEKITPPRKTKHRKPTTSVLRCSDIIYLVHLDVYLTFDVKLIKSTRRTVIWEGHGCMYPGSLRGELSCERDMAVCILRVYEANCHVRGARLVVCWESMRHTVMWEEQGWLYPGSLRGKLSCERDTAVCILGV